jgi:hypothetical protein
MKTQVNKTYNPYKGLQLIKNWCKERHILILENPGNRAEYWSPSEDEGQAKIYLPKHASINNKLYTILHECGHHLVGLRGQLQRYGEGYTIGYDKKHAKTLRYRVEVIDEELEAWHRGLLLAKRLGVYVDVEKYKLLRDRCIKRYAALVTRNYRKFTLKT